MFPLMKIHIASVFTRCGFSLPLLPAEKYALIFFFTHGLCYSKKVIEPDNTKMNV